MLFRIVAPAAVLTLSMLFSACSTQKAEKPRPRPSAPVVVAIVGQRDVPVLQRAIGAMEASESVTIKTRIDGELIKVAFKEGQDVQKGALLYLIDPRSYQAALKKAEAALARDRVIMGNAKANYERYRQLVKDGIVTQ
jgi:multidrug efflux system membrane fusion protein